MIQLIKVCGLPVERYFNPEIIREESEQDVYKRQAFDTLEKSLDLQGFFSP